MFDSTFLNRKMQSNRKGAVLPLFAMMLPVILILCGFAINMAYMQLVATEMKVSTDVTSHAGGRALSEAQREIVNNVPASVRRAQIVQQTYDTIETASQWNQVGGRVIEVRLDDRDVHFGFSIRPPGEMYEFTRVPADEIRSGAQRASSIGVLGRVDLPMIFQTLNTGAFQSERRSIATQVDRDIALVLDRSGSMLWYKDMVDFDQTMSDLYNDILRKRRIVKDRWGREFYQYYSERRISYYDYIRSLGYYEWNNRWFRDDLYRRVFSDDLRDELLDYWGDTGEDAHHDMYEYISDWKQYAIDFDDGFMTQAPRHSRWSFLVKGVSAFLDVLGGTTDGATSGTDQKELVSLVTFDRTARVDAALTDDDIQNGGVAYYQNIRDVVADIVPLGGTGIGNGLSTGLPPIVDPDWALNNNLPGASARPFAEKTIVVLTDGANNADTPDPVNVVMNLVENNAVTIHAVTFTPGADQTAMRQVVENGGGSAFHANDGEFLVAIFEEIANNLPTILTE